MNLLMSPQMMIVIPRIVECMEGVARGLYPTWLKDLSMDIFGATNGMDNFEGRK